MFSFELGGGSAVIELDTCASPPPNLRGLEGECKEKISKGNAADGEQVMSAHPTQREGQGAGEEVEFPTKDASPVLHRSHSPPYSSDRGETGKHV